jgi:phosphoribosylformimino-5-aminoimidazole carboxamide ribotide isomerase
MIKIIPAIDIIDGQCVRLSQGDYNQKKVYNEDPLEVAMAFEDNGIKFLHLVDLDGAKAKHVVNIKVLEKITSNTNIKVDFGGGIKSNDDIKRVFNAGANQVTIGTIAVTQKSLFTEWLKKYGFEKIILGADVNKDKISISGWMKDSDITLHDFLRDYIYIGVKYVLCTDISKDGMLQGAAIELYKKINKQFPEINLIASGGITDIKEVQELNEAGIYGAVIGKAIYEGKINLKDLKQFAG